MSNISSNVEMESLLEKLNAIIDRLINKEGILIVTTDHENKAERILSLNVNYDIPNF